MVSPPWSWNHCSFGCARRSHETAEHVRLDFAAGRASSRRDSDSGISLTAEGRLQGASSDPDGGRGVGEERSDHRARYAELANCRGTRFVDSTDRYQWRRGSLRSGCGDRQLTEPHGRGPGFVMMPWETPDQMRRSPASS